MLKSRKRTAVSRPRLLALLLALATLVVYLPVTSHEFLNYDDDDYITGNDMVQQGLTLAGVVWAFTTFHAANWHPLTWLSHMADCELFQLNSGAHHFINALLHAANSALVFVLLWRLTRQTPPAVVVAALFAWHPLHVESVAWAAERKDVLSTCFGLLALLAYTKYVEIGGRRAENGGQRTEDRERRMEGKHPTAERRPRTNIQNPTSIGEQGLTSVFRLLFPLPASRFYFLSLSCFALGLLAKPMVVTLPFVLLLLDFWPLRRFEISTLTSQPSTIWRLTVEKWPFFLLSLGSCVLTVMAQQAGQAVASLETVPMSYRLENSVVALSRYLLKTVWPADLAVIYPAAPIPGASLAFAGVVFILVSAAVWLARNRSRCWLVGWLWFIGTLTPVIGLVQVGAATMADRYTYLPSIGIFMAVTFGLYELAEAKKRVFLFASALPLLGCVLATERQLGCWRNSETLFRHALAFTQDNEPARLNLGIALDLQDRWPEALSEYREAVRLQPGHYRTHFAIGNVLVKMGQPAAALAEYQLCLGRDPGIPALHNAAGVALAAQGNCVAAQAEFTVAEKLDSHYAQPHLEWAKVCFQQGLDRQAVDELWAAARAAPYDFRTLATVARYLAATANDTIRDGPGALALALKAGELSRNRQPEAFDALGMAFAATGDFSNAVICAQNALEFLPPSKPKAAGDILHHLKSYQDHQPWRETFQLTNPPPPLSPGRFIAVP